MFSGGSWSLTPAVHWVLRCTHRHRGRSSLSNRGRLLIGTVTPAPCIIIECDGDDRPIVQTTGDLTDSTPDALLSQILRGGIVGLGGAVFPTAQKLMQARTGNLECLILNGVECEPYISCDDMLMRECAAQVVGGAQVLMHALQIATCFVVVESDKPEALESLG